jgi:alkylated DNA repair dioxygenase AlkB
MNAATRGRVRPASQESDLFGLSSGAPEGFHYRADLLTPSEEEVLAAGLAALPFQPFDFHGYQANRRVVSFGLRYDYQSRAIAEAAPLPAFLEDLCAKAAEAFERRPEDFRQVLINDYPPGAGIGWHRDKSHFGEVIGVSLLAPCPFRFRRAAGESWERATIDLAPRSAYLLSGLSRTAWEHSITPLDRHRVSITFRTLVKPQTQSNGSVRY